MRLRRAIADSRPGVAATELALLCPFLAFMMVVAIDYCRVFNLTQTVESAAQNAALYAAGVSASDPDNFASQIAAGQQAALDEGSRLSPPLTASNVSVSVNNNIATATVTYAFTTITRIPGLPTSMTVTRTVNIPIVPQNPGYAYGNGNASVGSGGLNIDLGLNLGGLGLNTGLNVGPGGINLGLNLGLGQGSNTVVDTSTGISSDGSSGSSGSSESSGSSGSSGSGGSSSTSGSNSSCTSTRCCSSDVCHRNHGVGCCNNGRKCDDND